MFNVSQAYIQNHMIILCVSIYTVYGTMLHTKVALSPYTNICVCVCVNNIYIHICMIGSGILICAFRHVYICAYM